MATDTPARLAGRPRPWLLILLGIVVVGYVLVSMFSGGPAVPSATTAPPQRPNAAGGEGPVDPAELDVKIEALTQPADTTPEAERNPFRFQPKAAPAPPPAQTAPGRPRTPPESGPPPPPSGPPPIGNTIKFIGIVDTGTEKVGAFSDCKGLPFPGRQGEVIEGRYRVVRIGVESAVLEYVDGTGRTTLPLNGQACVGK